MGQIYVVASFAVYSLRVADLTWRTNRRVSWLRSSAGWFLS